MICPYCGAAVEDRAAYCPNCNSSLQNAASFSTQEPMQMQPVYTQEPVTVQTPELGMGWYKFLIWFSLFAGALLNLATGIQILTGAHYDGMENMVWNFYDGLKEVDTIVGFASIALAVLCIVTRFSLSGYKKNGPKLLLVNYVASAAVNLFYVIAVGSIVSSYGVQLDNSSAYASVAVSLVMVAINQSYFKKREHLFVN